MTVGKIGSVGPLREPFSDKDLKVSTLAFGWFLGFSFFVIWHAIQQSKKISVYVVLIWCEIIASCGLAVICWLYLIEVIPPCFAFFFAILTCWALQVQFLLQIIINRICLLWPNKRHKQYLKYGTAAVITAINIAVYCIWIPARLQVSEEYHKINNTWDRTEKSIYLVVDLYLNYTFIMTVSERLVANGLERYRPLVNFNIQMIAVSISMDALVIGMMSYPNSFVYMAFHPVAYMVKLNIEMALSSLIVEIASVKGQKKPDKIDFTAQALEIAVTTHVITEAVQMDNLSAYPERTTRTPARPALKERLEKIRANKLRGQEPARQDPMGRRGSYHSDWSIELEAQEDKLNWQEGESTALGVTDSQAMRKVAFRDEDVHTP